MRSKAVTSLALAAAVGLFAVAAPLTAQGPPQVKPGPEHAIFKDWAGKWDATIKDGGGEFKGVATWEVVLNDLWVAEHFKADFGGKPFEGMGATSYDPAKKKYVNVWIDSMSTSPLISEGTYDKATKTLKMTGNMPGPDGKLSKVNMTYVQKDADTKVFTLTGAGPDGKTMEMLHITYKRRAK